MANDATTINKASFSPFSMPGAYPLPPSSTISANTPPSSSSSSSPSALSISIPDLYLPSPTLSIPDDWRLSPTAATTSTPPPSPTAALLPPMPGGWPSPSPPSPLSSPTVTDDGDEDGDDGDNRSWQTDMSSLLSAPAFSSTTTMMKDNDYYDSCRLRAARLAKAIQAQLQAASAERERGEDRSDARLGDYDGVTRLGDRNGEMDGRGDGRVVGFDGHQDEDDDGDDDVIETVYEEEDGDGWQREEEDGDVVEIEVVDEDDDREGETARVFAYVCEDGEMGEFVVVGDSGEDDSEEGS